MHGRVTLGVMTLPVRISVALAAAVACLAIAQPASARSCPPPDYPGSGYFNTLSVKNTKCAKGRKVALAHYRCRTEDGRKGRCGRKVLRFRCSEKRFNSISTEYSSRVTCKRGAKTVKFVYQQNT